MDIIAMAAQMIREGREGRITERRRLEGRLERISEMLEDGTIRRGRERDYWLGQKTYALRQLACLARLDELDAEFAHLDSLDSVA